MLKENWSSEHKKIYEELDFSNLKSEDWSFINIQRNKNMSEKFDFIFASRFWAGVLLSASITLADPGFPTQEWYVTLSKFLGLVAGQFLAVKTIDRNTDKRLEAAKIGAGQTTDESKVL